MRTGAGTRAGWVGRALAGLGVCAALVGTGVTAQAASSAARRGWEADCFTAGGQVVERARDRSNPLVVATHDLVYLCVAPEGTVIAERW